MDNGSEDNPATTNVVNLDDVRGAARTEALAYAQEVNDQCRLGRHPELANGYISKNTPLATVSRELLELRAREDQMRPVDTIDTSAAVRAGQMGNQAADVIKANAERMRAYQTPYRGGGF